MENKVFHAYSEFLLDIDSAEPYLAADKIDISIRHAISAAENHCAVPPRPPWSE